MTALFPVITVRKEGFWHVGRCKGRDDYVIGVGRKQVLAMAYDYFWRVKEDAQAA